MIKILLPVLFISFILAKGVHAHDLNTDSLEVHTFALTHDSSEQAHGLCISCLLSIYKIQSNRISGDFSIDLSSLINSPGDLWFFSSLIYQNAATRAPPVV